MTIKTNTLNAYKECKILASALTPEISIGEDDDSQVDSHFLIGQERAKQALAFGLGVKSTGYNIYVMGEQATGRFTLITDYIQNEIRRTPEIFDWCYLNNFENEREPLVLKLPAGASKSLVNDMNALVDEVLATFPTAYENPGYQRRKAAIARHYEQKYDHAIDQVEAYALSKSVALIEDGSSISFSPIVDGKPVSDAEFTSYPDDVRKDYYALIDSLEEALTEALLELPGWQRESTEKLKQLKKDVTEQAIRPLIKELQHKYSGNLQVQRYITSLKPNLIDAVIEHLGTTGKDEKQDEYDHRDIFVETYVPNVLVASKVDASVPLVYEANPTYQNLFGKIEYTSVQGSVYTSYRMITAGALHKANGGYLVVEADKLLANPQVWDALKLALKFGNIRLDIPQHEPGMVNSITLSPEPIKLDVKLILLGSRSLYYALQDYDHEFPELCRVLVDFDDEIPLTPETQSQFIKRIKLEVQKLNIESIDNNALKALLTFSLRTAEHQEKLSARFAEIIELLHEAAYFCHQEKSNTINVNIVQRALQAKKYRTGRVSSQFLEDMQEGHVIIRTAGSACGTLNGLTVLDIGDTAFGTPARITATVYAGSNGIIDIEREVELGQSIHSKGVMLLSGYLGNKYAQSFPLTLSANIALEQSYGYIDGDSASLAELVALISALTDTPIHQGIAVTGSINQLGEVQAVGGVNEKIEGFFELCATRGLSGEQGVIIPRSNCVNLVLSQTVIAAVEANAFHIYSVANVDQAIEILTGKIAGTLSSQGRYPKKSVHSMAVQRLHAIADVVNGGDGE
ncbi:Lon protease family protein [Agaribacter marinus]|uniref:endopeptidase La n=1 Tax=Agaribacter marinus TaxID=1431249 RepID=A0AA37SXR3_9ALTE|nr:ATP-binding protein [Agaribacter marinus]GLR70484.1 ATP-dependent protease [Agaribacter marinus]